MRRLQITQLKSSEQSSLLCH